MESISATFDLKKKIDEIAEYIDVSEIHNFLKQAEGISSEKTGVDYYREVLNALKSYKFHKYFNPMRAAFNILSNNIAYLHDETKIEKLEEYFNSLLYIFSDNNRANKKISMLKKELRAVLKRPGKKDPNFNISKQAYLLNCMFAIQFFLSMEYLGGLMHETWCIDRITKRDADRIILNRDIIDKDGQIIKEFDALLFFSEKAHVVEFKYILSRYVFHQVFSYPDQPGRFSHLQVLADKEICEYNCIPDIDSIEIIFTVIDDSMKESDLYEGLFSLEDNASMVLSSEEFTQTLFADSHTKFLLKTTNIKNITFTKYSDFSPFRLEPSLFQYVFKNDIYKDFLL